MGFDQTSPFLLFLSHSVVDIFRIVKGSISTVGQMASCYLQTLIDAEFIVDSMNASCPVLEAAKQPRTITCPSPRILILLLKGCLWFVPNMSAVTRSLIYLSCFNVLFRL